MHAGINAFIFFKPIHVEFLLLATERDNMTNIILFIILEFHVEHDSSVIKSFLSSTLVTPISLHLGQGLEIGRGHSEKFPNPFIPRDNSDQQPHTSLSLKTIVSL